MNTTVNCNKCSSVVVPRLWHYKPAMPLRYLKTQHICPICGACMYETGGQTHWMTHVIAVPILALWMIFTREGVFLIAVPIGVYYLYAGLKFYKFMVGWMRRVLRLPS